MNDEREKLLNALQSATRMENVLTIFFLQTVAQRLGINSSDCQCLNVLDSEGPLTVGQLAERIGLTRGGAITTALERLEKAGMITRERDPGNRRQVLVQITDQALQRSWPLIAQFTEEWKAIIASYSDRELRVITDYIERGNAAAREAIRRLQDEGRTH